MLDCRRASGRLMMRPERDLASVATPNVRVQPRAAALGLGRAMQDKPQQRAAQDQCRCGSAATRG